MPYELSFTQVVPVVDREQYINDCCVGGDAVVDRLMPVVVAGGYDEIETHQEDWGWFIWFRAGSVHLAIDIFTDDPDAGAFRVRLTSRLKKKWFGHKEQDTPELEILKSQVLREIEVWTGRSVEVERCE